MTEPDQDERPTEEQIMALMWAWFDTAESLSAEISAGPLYPTPEPGSRMALDDEATKPYLLSHCLQSLLNNAIEHVMALAALVRTAGLMQGGPPFSLSRAATESAATAYWLLDPDERKQRIQRHLVHQSQDRFDYQTVAKLISDRLGQPTAADVEERKTYITDVREATKLPTLPGQLKMGDMIKSVDKAIDATTHFEVYWRTASGFGHGRPWARMNVLIRSEITAISDELATVTLVTDPARVLWGVAASHELIDRALRMYGSACKSPIG